MSQVDTAATDPGILPLFCSLQEQIISWAEKSTMPLTWQTLSAHAGVWLSSKSSCSLMTPITCVAGGSGTYCTKSNALLDWMKGTDGWIDGWMQGGRERGRRALTTKGGTSAKADVLPHPGKGFIPRKNTCARSHTHRHFLSFYVSINLVLWKMFSIRFRHFQTTFSFQSYSYLH